MVRTRAKPIINEIDFMILKAIQKDNFTTFSDLVKQPIGSYSALIYCLKKLKEKGIIEEKINPKNRREKILTYCYDKIGLNDIIDFIEKLSRFRR